MVQIGDECDPVVGELGVEIAHRETNLRGLEPDVVPAKERRCETLRDPPQRGLGESLEKGGTPLPRRPVAARMQEGSLHCCTRATSGELTARVGD
jgi:hypothetical protein